MRTRDRSLGLCSEHATATARWRPRGLLWAAWQGEEAPARAKEGGGKQQGDAWKPARRRTWPGAALHGRRRCTAATAGEQRKELEVEEKGPKHNFQKFQGPVCKPAITFKIGLK